MAKPQQHATPKRAKHTTPKSPTKPRNPKPKTKLLDRNGLNRKTKTYSEYRHQRKRVRDLITKEGRRQGRAFNIERILGSIPDSYQRMRSEVKRLKQITSRSQVRDLYGGGGGAGGAAANIPKETLRLVPQILLSIPPDKPPETIKPRRHRVVARKEPEVIKETERIEEHLSDKDAEDLQRVVDKIEEQEWTEQDEQQFRDMLRRNGINPDNKQELQDYEDEQQLKQWERERYQDEEEEDEIQQDENIIYSYEEMPVISRANDVPDLPSETDIILEAWYNQMVNVPNGDKPIDPWFSAKWNAIDLNDLLMTFANEAAGEFGKDTLARAIRNTAEEQYRDPWVTGWDYDSRHKMSYLVALADELHKLDPTGSSDTLYDIIAAIRQIMDEGYLDDFK